MDKDLSIIVAAHREGVLIHKTLKSIQRSSAEVRGKYELIITIDNGDEETIDCINRFRTSNPDLNVRILKNNFRDVAKSRNAAIDCAVGQYITFIDGDDIMSKEWLARALTFLQSKPYGQYVAHPEWTIEFGTTNSIIKRHGDMSYAQNALLNVWAGCWNVVLMAPAKLIKQLKYQPNEACFGFEDWRLSCDLIFLKTHNVLVPQTAVFVRRKESNSVWNAHRNNKAVLKASELLKPSNFKKINIDFKLDKVTSSPPDNTPTFFSHLKEFVKRNRYLFKIAKIIRNFYYRSFTQKESEIPNWLLTEWKNLHEIEKQIFPEPSIINYPSFYDSITNSHYRVGQAYHRLCNLISEDEYDYLLIVPWLINGGADLFAINYANAMDKLGLRVVVLASNLDAPTSNVTQKLNKKVIFLNINDLLNAASPAEIERLLEQFIENAHIKIIHVLNSVAGYDFVESHQNYLRKTNRKVIVTSYSQSVDENGKIFGFSHTHVPKVYSFSDLITTDNVELKQMWIQEYGFDPKKIVVHDQMLEVNIKRDHPKITRKILWAARIAPEKNPDLVKQIAQLLGNDYQIDMFGNIDNTIDFNIKQLPSNLTYQGPFEDIFALPLNDYDFYLYTSLFDGTPNTLIEVSLAGLPIIASKIGGIKSLLNDTGDLLVQEHLQAEVYVKKIKNFYKNFQQHQQLAIIKQAQFKQKFSRKNFTKQVKTLLEMIDYKV